MPKYAVLPARKHPRRLTTGLLLSLVLAAISITPPCSRADTWYAPVPLTDYLYLYCPESGCSSIPYATEAEAGNVPRSAVCPVYDEATGRIENLQVGVSTLPTSGWYPPSSHDLEGHATDDGNYPGYFHGLETYNLIHWNAVHTCPNGQSVTRPFTVKRYRTVMCADITQYRGTEGYYPCLVDQDFSLRLDDITDDSGINLGAPEPLCTVGNPINVVTGNKYQHEVVVPQVGVVPALGIHYNSQDNSTSRVGTRWRHDLERTLRRIATATPDNSTTFSTPRDTREQACQDGLAELRSMLPAHLQQAEATLAGDARCQVRLADGTLWRTIPVYNMVTGATTPPSTPGEDPVELTRPDGKIIRFIAHQGRWHNASGGFEVLEEILHLDDQRLGWLLRTDTDDLEAYDLRGRLLTIVHTGGSSLSLEYDEQDQIRAARTSPGGALFFEHDGNGYLRRVTDHTGRAWILQRDELGNLAQLTRPSDDTMPRIRLYHYEQPGQPHALTGITDEDGSRVASFEYDTRGRAIASHHSPPPGTPPEQRIDGLIIDYIDDTRRQVNWSDGRQDRYTTSRINGVAVSTTVEVAPCAGCPGEQLSRRFDANSPLLLSETRAGTTTIWGNHDSRGNPRYRVTAAGTTDEHRVEYVYDPRFAHLVSAIIAPSTYQLADGNRVQRFSYDDLGRLLEHSIEGYRGDNGQAVSRVTRYRWDGPRGQLSLIDGPRTDVADLTHLQYYPDSATAGTQRARLRRVSSPTGIALQEELLYNPAGLLVSRLLPSGLRQEFEYTPGSLRPRQTRDVGPASTRISRQEWSAAGRLLAYTGEHPDRSRTTLTYHYDSAGRLVETVNALGESIRLTLDTQGRRIRETWYDAAAVAGRSIHRQYEHGGQRVTVVSGRRTASQSSDHEGRVLQKSLGTGQDSVTLLYHRDARGRLRSVEYQEPASGAFISSISYDYDPAGYLARITDENGNVTTRVHDDLGNRLSSHSSDTGLTLFSYDEAGNLASRTSNSGDTLHFEHDPDNRLTAVLGQDIDNRWVYDNCEHGENRVCVVSAAGQEVHYAWSPHGDLLRHQETDYHYDNLGRLTGTSLPSGADLDYRYDAAGKISAVLLRSDGQTRVLAQVTRRLPFGPPTQLQLGNAITIDRQHDQDWTPLAEQSPGIVDQQWSHWDSRGNLVGGSLDGIAFEYSYDPVSRLLTSSGPGLSRRYAWDDAGNRVGEAEYNYLFTGSNRLTGVDGIPRGYDSNGNTKFIGNLELDRDSLHRVTALSRYGDMISSHHYNGLGQRHAKQLQNGAVIHYLYDPEGHLVVEHDDNGRILREYVYLDSRLLAVLDRDADADGSVDTNDNCMFTPNGMLSTGRADAIQRDTDADGFGNACDADMNNDGMVNSLDLGLFRTRLFSNDDDADMNGDNIVNSLDLGLLKQAFLSPPGPSAQHEQPPPLRVLYAHNDLSGAPIALSDDAGRLVWRAVIEPFGVADIDTDPDGNGLPTRMDLRRPGQYHDMESGLYYNMNRFYDPQAGRYLSADPSGTSSGPHPYAYVGNQPVNRIDRLGLYTSNPASLLPDNGNTRPGYTPQDFVCTGIGARLQALLSNAKNNACFTRCCVEHDGCYQFYDCNASSWLRNFFGADRPCQRCNKQAFGCFLQARDTTECDRDCG